MEVVNTLDIGGTQWELQDVEARNRIAELEQNLSAQDLENIRITMNPGYTAVAAYLHNHYKVGKIHFAIVELNNVSGQNIGTSGSAKIGTINIKPKKETSFLLNDFNNNKILRCYITKDGTITIGESNGVVQGNNVCLGEIIFSEA